MIKIECSRLYIRDHLLEDLPGYHRIMSDKEAMFFLPDLLSETLEESRLSLKISIEESYRGDDRTKYFWGIFLKDDTYIGEIGYTVNSIDDQRYKCVHLGYFIHQDHWNKGYVSEAVAAVINFAFTSNNVIKIETGCLCNNQYSERIMVKNGFQRESYKKQNQWLECKWYDRVEYGLLRDQYLQIDQG